MSGTAQAQAGTEAWCGYDIDPFGLWGRHIVQEKGDAGVKSRAFRSATASRAIAHHARDAFIDRHEAARIMYKALRRG